MPQTTSPDLRLFEATAAKNHAIYDGALVEQFRRYSNWTRPTITTPLTLDEFVAHTQQKLSEFLQQLPDEGLSKGIASQDLSKRRILLQHLARNFVMLWGGEIHTNKGDVQEVLMQVRNNMHMLIMRKHLFIEDPTSPLCTHHRTNRVPTDVGLQPAIRLGDEDVTVARFIAGQNSHLHGKPEYSQHTLDILTQVQPFLTEVDDTHIERRLLDLRLQLQELVKPYMELHQELRSRLLKVIADDWLKHYSGEEGAILLEELEEEVREETGIENVLQEPPQKILQICFGHTLAQGEWDDVAKAKLLRRKPILESVMYEAAQTGDRNTLQLASDVCGKFSRVLDRTFGDLGHLSLIVSTCAIDIDMHRYKNGALV